MVYLAVLWYNYIIPTLIPILNYSVIGTYPFPVFIVKRSSHIDGSSHIFYGKCTTKVSSSNLITNSWRWKSKYIELDSFSERSLVENNFWVKSFLTLRLLTFIFVISGNGENSVLNIFIFIYFSFIQMFVEIRGIIVLISNSNPIGIFKNRL